MLLSIFDSSAALAFFFNEPGAKNAEKYIDGSYMSALNYSEVWQKASEYKDFKLSMIPDVFKVVSFDADLAITAAGLKAITKRFGLSLADRACIATAINLKLPVVTANKIWREIKLPIKVITIR